MRPLRINGEIMSTLFSVPSALLQENVQRQAKRLKSSLGIPLTAAKNILASAAYRCADWQDLQKRLQSDTIGNRALLLSTLPKSSEAKAYLNQNIHHISKAIGRSVLTNRNLAGMCQIVRFVFEENDAETTLSDLFEPLTTLPWRSSGIGPDPSAIIETFTVINGVPIKLIGTRVYLPEYFNFDSELASCAKHAVNDGTQFEIMWSAPEAWYAAARSYLSIEDEDEFYNASLELPLVELDANMHNHQQWFQKVLQVWNDSTRYGGEEEMQFIPTVLGSGCYLVFGIPSPAPVHVASPDETTIFMSSDYDNDSKIVLLNNQALSVEWLSVDSGTNIHAASFDDHFKTVWNSLFSHQNCNSNLYQTDRWPSSVFFVTPATPWDIKHAMRLEISAEDGFEAYVIKTNNIQLADEVIEKIAKHELTSFVSEIGHVRYIAELDASKYDEIHSFNLALDIVGKNHWSGSNLVTALFARGTDEKRIFYVELNARIFTLIDMIGKKNVLDALRHGLVLQRRLGFLESLDKLPTWCSKLPESSPILKEIVDIKSHVDNSDVPFDLWSQLKRVHYRRDNY
jgi:hypothetical protein